jgi:pimeloyl-ACP methyl ester carboxylesterase
MVGNSAGAQIALELARRGVGGAVVALDPTGFASPAQRRLSGFSFRVSDKLLRALLPVMPWLTSNPVTRTLVFSLLLVRPWALPSALALRLVQDWAAATSFDDLLDSLVHGPQQQGAPAGSTPGPVVIGWGRNDRVTFPSQAEKAVRSFPHAQLHWFDRCGHLPYLDAPGGTIRLILDSTT